MQAQPPHYVPGLDLLRFIAAFAVMIYHLAFWSWAFPAGQVALASKGVADFHDGTAITSVGWVGVQLFFVISGFVIATSASHSSASRFFISRFTRLVPAVWICATITLIAWLLIDIGSPAAHLRAYANSVAFIPMPTWVDSVYWTLGVEVAFYTLVLGLVRHQRLHWLKPMMYAIGLTSSLFWVAHAVCATDPDGAASALLGSLQRSRVAQLLLLHHGVFFAMGVLLWMRLQARSRDQLYWLLIFLVGGCLQIVAESELKFEKTGVTVSALLACSLWLLSMAALYWTTTSNHWMQSLSATSLRLLRRLGLITYPLYLLHNVAGGALLGALVGWGMETTDALISTITAIIALSWWISAAPEPALQKATRDALTSIASRWRPSWAGPTRRDPR